MGRSGSHLGKVPLTQGQAGAFLVVTGATPGTQWNGDKDAK